MKKLWLLLSLPLMLLGCSDTQEHRVKKQYTCLGYVFDDYFKCSCDLKYYNKRTGQDELSTWKGYLNKFYVDESTSVDYFYECTNNYYVLVVGVRQ